MIEHIASLVLKEARGRPGKDSVGNIYLVMDDLEKLIICIIENIRLIKRRQEEKENKKRDFKRVK